MGTVNDRAPAICVSLTWSHHMYWLLVSREEADARLGREEVEFGKNYGDPVAAFKYEKVRAAKSPVI